MKKIVLSIFVLEFFLVFYNYAQTIKGYVVDALNKEPLIGANIIYLGTNDKISSDIDGNFTLSLKSRKSIIEISCIGYKSLIDTIDLDNKKCDSLKYELQPFAIGITEYLFQLSKEDALSDISQNRYRIYIHEFDDSIRTITEKVASSYGFTIYWPTEASIMILEVGDYNNTMIKYLETRNGVNWYQRFKKDLEDALKKR